MTRPSGIILLFGAIVCAAISFAAGIGVDRQLLGPTPPADGRAKSGASVRNYDGKETTHSAPNAATAADLHAGKNAPKASDRVRPVPITKVAEGRVLAEFEHMDAVLLGVNELIQYHPETLAQIVAAIHENIKIVGVVANEQQEADTIELLKKHKLPADAIEFFHWPIEAMWVRDYAPYFLVSDHPTVIDFSYGEKNRDLEEQLPVALAATYGFRYDHCHLTFEGGNLCPNGKGLCVSTTRLLDRNAERGYSAEQIGSLLHDHFHFERWIRLLPLQNEPTGHADMFFTLLSPNKCLLGTIDPSEDPVNAKVLDDDAVILKGEDTLAGPMEVERIPMPSHKDGVWRTYTNVIFANGVLLVPQYPDADPKLDERALAIYRDLLPKWKVVGIDCTKLIAKRGALHCISRHIARFPSQAND